MANENERPDPNKFLTDPAFQADRDLFNVAIDARLKFHAEEAAKRKAENAPKNIFDVLFGPKS